MPEAGPLSDPAAERFEFGLNWSRFLRELTDEQIDTAVASLRETLEIETLEKLTFLDIGCGSGLFSLAARRLGARVHSFDFDRNSVGCAQTLRQRYFPDDSNWTIEWGDALDAGYLRSLGTFDVVYSWGVLHHTGSMWQALENAIIPLRPGGTLFIAIYNDQGWRSDAWRVVKRTYNALPSWGRFVIMGPAWFRFRVIPPVLRRFRARSRHTGSVWNRGMVFKTDLVDWVGGYPFEVSSPEPIIAFYRARGLTLKRLLDVGRALGCNQYVFQAPADPAAAG